ncbi:hypothetical protein [Nonomuraea sp. NPDC052265]|uniref:hypothetical protein n=1 Tax=Nonomuraea sp. NPDC052265 TaxID=3364374 RepID=UPI0037C6539B
MTANCSAGRGLPVGRPIVRSFTGGAGPLLQPDERRTIDDLVAAHGMRPAPPDPSGLTFSQMAQGLLESLDRPLPPLGATILAYQEPDITVAEVAGSRVADLCPGDPVAFSVSGQGVGAPFTALRVLHAMYAAGELTGGAVFAFDQSASLYADGNRAERDRVVLLVTGDVGSDGLMLDVLDEVPADDPASVLHGALDEMPVTVGAQLADHLGPAARRRSVEITRERGCAAVWATAAASWRPGRRSLVADYDPGTRRLFRALLQPG